MKSGRNPARSSQLGAIAQGSSRLILPISKILLYLIQVVTNLGSEYRVEGKETYFC